MSHELLGERFFGNRGLSGWHTLGPVFDDKDLTFEEALKRAGMDQVVVHKLPNYSSFGEGDDMYVLDAGTYTLWRDPVDDETQPVPLGTVSREYEVLQITDMAEMLEPLRKTWPLETGGIIRNGRQAFLTMDGGQFDVAGDSCRWYIQLFNSWDGKGGLQVLLSPVRVICSNTFALSESRAELNVTLRHTSGVRMMAEMWLQVVAGMREAMKATQEEFEAMTARKVAFEDGLKILNAAFPMPKEPKILAVAADAIKAADTPEQAELVQRAVEEATTRYEGETKRQQAKRDAGVELFTAANEEFGQFANTVWLWYNASTELSNWREGPNAAESILVPGGVRHKELKAAHAMAVDLATGKTVEVPA